jgi:hypothetical protein
MNNSEMHRDTENNKFDGRVAQSDSYQLSDDELQRLRQLSETAFREKSEYESLWRQVAVYCGLDRYFERGNRNSRKQDLEINNSQAVIALSQTTDSMLGILIGDGNFFKLKLKNSVKDILRENSIFFSLGEIEDYIDYINNIIREEYFSRECNFTKVLHRSIKEYFAFGNTGIGIFYNRNHERGYSQSKLNFVNYSVNNTAFLEGIDGNIDTIFMRYRWTARKIVETFCRDEETGEIDREKLSGFPDAIRSAYASPGSTLDKFDIDYVLIPNGERRVKARDGIYSAKYVGLFLSFNLKYIFEKEYFREIPLKIIRDNVSSNETYGKGIACNILSEMELTNKISGDIIEQVENTVNPYLALYENLLDYDKIVLDRNKPLILRASQNNPTPNPPIFPVIANGDIASVVQIILPELKNNITSGLKADVFMDFNSRSNMTATESMQRYNIRNKVLFANALDFQSLLTHMITYSYWLLAKNNLLGVGSLFRSRGQPPAEQEMEETEEDLVKRALTRVMETPGSQAIEFLEQNNIDWFDIEYTSELSQISKTAEIQNLTNFLGTMTMVAQVYPTALKRIDFSKIVEKIDGLFNNTSLLLDETEFKKQLENEAVATQQQNELASLQSQANINVANANALKTQREAVALRGDDY